MKNGQIEFRNTPDYRTKNAPIRLTPGFPYSEKHSWTVFGTRCPRSETLDHTQPTHFRRVPRQTNTCTIRKLLASTSFEGIDSPGSFSNWIRSQITHSFLRKSHSKVQNRGGFWVVSSDNSPSRWSDPESLQHPLARTAFCRTTQAIAIDINLPEIDNMKYGDPKAKQKTLEGCFWGLN